MNKDEMMFMFFLIWVIGGGALAGLLLSIGMGGYR